MYKNEIDKLIKLSKYFTTPEIALPQIQERKVYKLTAKNTKDIFVLDYDRRGIVELKHKTQLRHDIDLLLIRVEINAPPHQNPDGTVLSRNHVHIYDEKYEMKIAYELQEIFPELIPPFQVSNIFSSFCKYINADIANIQFQGVL